MLDTMKQQVKGLVRQATGAAPSSTPAAKPTSADLANGFLGAVQVEQIRGSRLFNVSVTSSDPQFAARAADTLASEYVQFNLEYRTDATRKSLDFLAGEIAKQQKKVEDSERAMAEYRETNNALSLEDRQNTVVASLNQVNDQYTRIRTERIQKEALYNQIKSLPPASVGDAPAVSVEPGGAEPAHAGSPSCCARRCSSTNATAPRTRRSSRTKTPSSTRPSSCKPRSMRRCRRSAANTRRRARPKRAWPASSNSRRAPRWI